VARRDPDTDRDVRIAAILARGRQTRRPVSRALWIAAAAVATIAAIAAAVILLGVRGDPAPPTRVTERTSPADSPRDRPQGFGTGLALGAAAGVAIGFALGRQRRDHSSRSKP
jgi:hypothetical protein